MSPAGERGRSHRRALLKALAGVGIAVVAPAAGFAGWLYVDSGRSNVGTLSFRNRLQIPPLLEPTEGSDGRKQFTLTLQAGLSEFLPGTRTATWGVNGPYLGPTLRANRGDRVAVDVVNNLPEGTTLHWHGMHLPAEMDGGPHQFIGVDETSEPYWTIEQRASTLWYHPHLHQATALHVYRGVAGLFLIDDPDATALPIPKEYGVDDIPLILQDKEIDDDGTLDASNINYAGITITGLLGDKILVNGVYDPYLEVTSAVTRFRLLNASNARILYIGFEDGRQFSLIGSDSGLLAEPVQVDRLLLTPGERAEILVRFEPGEEVIMRSFPAPLETNFVYDRLAGGQDTHDLLKLVAAATLRDSPAPPSTLVPAPSAPDPTGPEYRLEMGDFTFNGEVMDMARLDRTVGAGTAEVWEIVNDQSIPHNFHIHGSSFHVLDIDGEPPTAAHFRGEKDTVYTPPRSTVRLAIQFLDHSDPQYPYMYHCHLLAHEDAGMMGQFVTVAGEDAGQVDEHWDGDSDHSDHADHDS